jgi:glycosyltransferase involved in cell wall biosynthesis
MSERRLRVLFVVSHPIQYAVPIFRLMAQEPQLDFHVAYCSLRGAEAANDPEFGRSVQWDVPLLDGYQWTQVPNQGSGGESFFGWSNPGLWKLIREGRFDAVLCQLGYLRCSFWISYLSARVHGTPFLFLTDASTIQPRDGRKWKIWLKKLAWPVLFRMFSQVLTASSAGSEMMRSLNIPEQRISMTLFTVDNDWWGAEAARVNRAAVRASWGLDGEERIVLFCAKLQPWKRPLDLLRAFGRAGIPRSTLLFAGDGALRAMVEAQASALGLGKRVRVLGFINQSQLPAVYRAADVMVIPSAYEPFGLVVNEAMLCGCVVIASDQVGAVRDLIFPGRTGYVYPCGDTGALARTLRDAFADPAKLAEIRGAAGNRIREWSPRASAAAMTAAIVRAAAGSARVSRQGKGDAVDPAFKADRFLPS